jgi:hypothetical protein
VSTFVLVLALLAQGAGAIEKGWLRLQTERDVEVIWDGVSLGRTDATGLLLVESIPPGDFSIRLRAPDFEPHEQNVRIAAGRNSISIELAPTNLQAPAPEPPRAPRESPAPLAQSATTSPAPDLEPEGALPAATAPNETASDETSEALTPSAETPALPAETDGKDAEASRSWLAALLGLLALGLAATVLLLRRRAPTPLPANEGNRAPAVSRPPITDEPRAVHAPERRVTETPDFLDQIRRREQQLDGSGEATVAETDADADIVIDVEYREVEGGTEP